MSPPSFYFLKLGVESKALLNFYKETFVKNSTLDKIQERTVVARCPHLKYPRKFFLKPPG